MAVKYLVKEGLRRAHLLQSVQRWVPDLEEARHRVVTSFHRLLHKSNLPKLDPSDRSIVAALLSHGACATTLASLDIAGTATMLQQSDRLLQEMERLPKQSGSKGYLVSAPRELFSSYPEIIEWGLHERLLAIAENYIGTPVTYRGVQARLDFPDGVVDETRLWHLDQEDARIMKIIIYLGDVDGAGGPFEYISASAGTLRSLARGPKLRIYDERSIATVVPTDKWRAIEGPRETVGFADTCTVFHRGRLPTGRTRKTLFFCYNSRSPFRPSYCPPLFVVDLFLKQVGVLSPRQREALDFSYLQ